jgi:hypothetical protein
MKLFDSSTWPENPTDADRRELANKYADLQIFKLKVLIFAAVVWGLHALLG